MMWLINFFSICGTGRTKEMKQVFYASIAKKISETTQISANDVFVMLNKIPWENWSFGQGKAQMIHKSNS